MNTKNLNKEKFFSKVSHDLRGSFTSILGFSNLMSDPDEHLTNEEVVEFAERIKNQSNESLELLVSFINWLKVQNYRSLLHEEEIDLTEILGEVINNLSGKIDDKKLNTVVNLKDEFFITADYEILFTILNNIFKFLIKAGAKQSEILFTAIEFKESINLKISASLNSLYSERLKDEDIENFDFDEALPIIFADGLIDAMGGSLIYSLEGENILINLSIPQKINNKEIILNRNN